MFGIIYYKKMRSPSEFATSALYDISAEMGTKYQNGSFMYHWYS